MTEQSKISYEEFQSRLEAAQEVFAAAYGVLPERDSWGFFAYGDAPGGIGGGFGALSWFKSADQLVEAIRGHIVFMNPGPVNLDAGQVDREIGDMVGDKTAIEVGSSDFLESLNRTLRHFSQIEWIGTFSDLLTQDGKFQRKVRLWYLENDEEFEDRPISEAEAGAFREALREYGI